MKLSNKKHTASGVVLVLCVISALASPLMADMTVTMKGYGALRQGSGGEFTFYEGTGWSSDPLDSYNPIVNHNGGFQTFCLERSEHIWTYKTYDTKLSNSAKNGGANSDENAIAGQDIISDGTAWLYEQFAAGTLSQYNYDDISARKISGEKLQKAFWCLEDELSMDYNNIYIKLLTESGQFDSISLAKQNYLGDKVAVMNLTLNGNRAQDQLMMAPTPVPAPGALTLAGIGVLIAGYRKRKHIA